MITFNALPMTLLDRLRDIGAVAVDLKKGKRHLLTLEFEGKPDPKTGTLRKRDMKMIFGPEDEDVSDGGVTEDWLEAAVKQIKSYQVQVDEQEHAMDEGPGEAS